MAKSTRLACKMHNSRSDPHGTTLSILCSRPDDGGTCNMSRDRQKRMVFFFSFDRVRLDASGANRHTQGAKGVEYLCVDDPGVLGSKKWTSSTYTERAGGVRWNRY